MLSFLRAIWRTISEYADTWRYMESALDASQERVIELERENELLKYDLGRAQIYYQALDKWNSDRLIMREHAAAILRSLQNNDPERVACEMRYLQLALRVSDEKPIRRNANDESL